MCDLCSGCARRRAPRTPQEAEGAAFIRHARAVFHEAIQFGAAQVKLHLETAPNRLRERERVPGEQAPTVIGVVD